MADGTDSIGQLGTALLVGNRPNNLKKLFLFLSFQYF